MKNLFITLLLIILSTPVNASWKGHIEIDEMTDRKSGYVVYKDQNIDELRTTCVKSRNNGEPLITVEMWWPNYLSGTYIYRFDKDKAVNKYESACCGMTRSISFHDDSKKFHHLMKNKNILRLEAWGYEYSYSTKISLNGYISAYNKACGWLETKNK